MTSLEGRVQHHTVCWKQQHTAFTAVVAGHAFALYQKDGSMRFCGLAKKDVKPECGRETEGWVESFWSLGDDKYYSKMFDTVASDEFVAQVILNALPELKA